MVNEFRKVRELEREVIGLAVEDLMGGVRKEYEELAGVFARQLDKCDAWLAEQPHFEVLNVEHGNVIRQPSTG